MSTEKDTVAGPVRERARDELRECRTLIQNLFEAHGNILKEQCVFQTLPL